MNVDGFGGDPFWLICLKVLGVFVLLVVIVLITIWAERRVVARMQSRVGPNRVGPFGLLQSLMDGVKLALKEARSNSASTSWRRCCPPSRRSWPGRSSRWDLRSPSSGSARCCS